jgi:hypothetical protein
MIRRRRLPETDHERRALAKVELLAEQLKQAEQALWRAAKDVRDMGIDIEIVAEAAQTSRATLYRKLTEVDATEASANG